MRIFIRLLLLALLALPYSASGQVITATIFGVVRDETGAILPGATITVKNLDTGIVRTTVTDDQGRYRVPQLAVGNYQVEASLTGFQTAVRSGITLTVGREAAVDFTLKVGEISERVTVIGEAPLVDTSSSAISALVDDKTIQDLPLNGRDLTQLVNLQPGAMEVRTASGTSSMISGVGPGKRISVSGSRTSYNLYSIDGVDVQDIHRQAPGSVSGGSLGVEGIREFSVLANNYSAEYSSQGGAVVNAITNSGTNDIHGSLFEFHRNSVLDAKNFFDKVDEPIPPFKRNQFGFALGGPIRKDQSFFFSSYEGLRERLGLSLVSRVPDENARKGLLPDPNRPGQLRDVGVHPLIAPYLALLPLPNGRNFGDGTAEFLTSFSRPTTENYFVSRVDHKFSDSDSLVARYIFDNSTVKFPNNGNVLALTSGELGWQSMMISESHLFSPTLINNFRLGFNRTREFITTGRLFELGPEFDFIPGQPFGNSSNIDVGGLTSIGGQSNHPKFYVVNSFQYSDDVAYTRGAHAFKFGVLVKRFQVNITAPQNLGGTYRFLSLDRFLRAEPFTFTGAKRGGDPTRSMRQNLVGVYVQDDIRVKRNLTLNLGLRYEFATSPTEKHGRITNVRSALDAAPTIGALYDNPSLRNFGPRIGFAWDLTGDGRTALRGGFGLFYQQLLSNVWFIDIVRQPPFFGIAQMRNPPFLAVFRTIDPAGITPNLQSLDFDLDQPYIMQYNLSLQREIASNTSMSIAYAGSRGNHLLYVRMANAAVPVILSDGRKFFPAGSQRRNPNFADDARQSSWAQSFYNSFQLSLRRRFAKGLQFQVSYTFSRSIDEGYDRWDFTQFGGTTGFQDPDDHKVGRGLSDFHVSNNFVFNYTYDLPIGPGQRIGGDLNGAAAKLLGGWQINGIVTLADGAPFTATLGYNAARDGVLNFTITPNLRAGASNNPVLGGPDRYFDPTAFEAQELGFYGNLGRNTIIGPGFANFDFALIKNTFIRSLSENFNVQFRAEFFNLFNRPQFANPAGQQRVIIINQGQGINPAAGRITSTVATSRQIQFALKVIF